jgi:hypothetical protein
MNLICKWFGHKGLDKLWQEKTKHRITIYSHCERCGWTHAIATAKDSTQKWHQKK